MSLGLRVGMSTLVVFIGATLLLVAKKAILQKTISVVSNCESGSNDSCWRSVHTNLDYCCSLNKALLLMQCLARDVEIHLYNNTALVTGEETRLHNVSNVTINGNGHFVQCLGHVGLAFINSGNISIKQTTFVECGQQLIHNNRTYWPAALSFLLSGQISLTKVIIFKSLGTGMMMIDVHGNSTVTDCELSSNLANPAKSNSFPGGGGMLLMFLNDRLNKEQATDAHTDLYINLIRLIFTANKVEGHSNQARGGALAIVAGNSSNNHVTMTDCYLTGNQANQGAGLYILLAGSSSKNAIIVNNTTFEGHNCYLSPDSRCVGGAVRIELLLDSYSTVAAHNHIALEAVLVSKNVAYAGGGIAVTTNRQFTHVAQTNTLTLKQATLEFNRAQMGSALHFSVSSQMSQGYLLQPILTSVNVCQSFVTNSSNVIVGQAAVFVSELPVSFQGNNQFTGNQGTALVLSKAHISIQRNAIMIFISNSGKLGGALALVNEAAITVQEQALLSFTNNTANDKGGAIYISNYYDNYAYPFTGQHCAIRDDIPPSKWRGTFVFDHNYAAQTRSSVFATSILSCRTETTKNGTRRYPFCWENWKYKGSSCENEVSTSPANIIVQTHDRESAFKIFPGYPFPLPIELVDDYNNTVTNRSVVTAFVTKGDSAVVDASSQYIAGGNTTIYGEPGTHVTVAIETAGMRVVYTELQIQFCSCPPGYTPTPVHKHKNSSTCSCSENDQLTNVIFCHQETYTSKISTKWCMTYDYQLNTTIVGSWRFYTQLSYSSSTNYVVLPQQNDQLDQFFCGQLNRTGRMCGECQNGTGVPVYSYDFHCVHCKEEEFYRNLAYYLIAELVPVTVFFLLVISLNINITSGAVCSFVLFSQLTTLPTEVFHTEDVFKQAYGKEGKVILSLFLLPYSIWNLDFFRTLVPSFCLSPGLKTMHVVALLYVSALYPLLLVILWYTFIELHSRNYRLVVILWGPFSKCLSRLRRYWQIQSTVVDAFATFLVLSYTKLCSVSFVLLVPNTLYNATGAIKDMKLLYLDSSVEFGSAEHIPFIIIAVVVIGVIIIPLPLLLLIYQFPITQQWINHTKLSQLSLSAFMDSFQGCYKDGGEGSKDCRWFSCVYFLVRIANLAITVTADNIFLERLLQMIVTVVVIFSLAVIQPYKKRYFTVLDTSIACLFILILSYGLMRPSSYFESYAFTIPFTIGLFVPFVYMVTYTTCQIVSKICCRSRNPTHIHKDDGQDHSYSLESSLPHRLLHPEDYRDSLQEQVPLLNAVDSNDRS